MIKGAIIVFVVSILCAVALPVPDIFRGIAAIPGIGALALVVVDLYRDSAAHRRAKELRRSEQDFTLGIASHMANATFDKHIAFCEAYFRTINEVVQEQLSKGPKSNALNAAQLLRTVREQYSPWLTKEIEDGLLPTEQALTRIGASSMLVDRTADDAKRSELIEKMFEMWSAVVGIPDKTTDEERQSAALEIRDHLRGVLGVDTLTALRRQALQSALRRTNRE